jgi:hypothetical protein
MMRPPTSGGRGESDFHDIDDAEITPKRGNPDTLPDSRPDDTPGQSPAEGAPDLRLPGADREDDLPERLGERVENGSSSAMATGEPDVLPDVEPPETTM